MNIAIFMNQTTKYLNTQGCRYLPLNLLYKHSSAQLFRITTGGRCEGSFMTCGETIGLTLHGALSLLTAGL